MGCYNIVETNFRLRFQHKKLIDVHKSVIDSFTVFP